MGIRYKTIKKRKFKILKTSITVVFAVLLLWREVIPIVQYTQRQSLPVPKLSQKSKPSVFLRKCSHGTIFQHAQKQLDLSAPLSETEEQLYRAVEEFAHSWYNHVQILSIISKRPLKQDTLCKRFG